MEEFGGEVMDEIKRIEREGKFSEGIALPGYHEVVDPLTPFERAINTCMHNVLNSEMDKSLKSFQAQALSNLMWFSIVNHHRLWYKPNNYGINKGKTLVIVDEESMLSELGSKTEEKTITSIDELPKELREALTKLVLSSKSFGPGKFSVN